jgi:DNA-binding NtrC family response regulator
MPQERFAYSIAPAARNHLAPVGAPVVCRCDRERQGCMITKVAPASALIEAARHAAEQAFAAGLGFDESLELYRKVLIIVALEQHQGSVARTAHYLKRHRNSLSRDLVQYEIQHLPVELRRRAKLQGKLSLEAQWIPLSPGEPAIA